MRNLIFKEKYIIIIVSKELSEGVKDEYSNRYNIYYRLYLCRLDLRIDAA